VRVSLGRAGGGIGGPVWCAADFSAGTTDWAQVLDAGRDRQLERITCNVLDGLSRV
jgi:hypothetical protein